MEIRAEFAVRGGGSTGVGEPLVHLEMGGGNRGVFGEIRPALSWKRGVHFRSVVYLAGGHAIGVAMGNQRGVFSITGRWRKGFCEWRQGSPWGVLSQPLLNQWFLKKGTISGISCCFWRNQWYFPYLTSGSRPSRKFIEFPLRILLLVGLLATRRQTGLSEGFGFGVGALSSATGSTADG